MRATTDLIEPELIAGLAKRDPHCIAALYDRHATTLLKIIYCSVKDHARAEAILEATLTRACRHIRQQQQQDKHLLLWMAGMVRKLVAETR
jgi:DNA-directed RNA polymerase specialized sigma24 family protein